MPTQGLKLMGLQDLGGKAIEPASHVRDSSGKHPGIGYRHQHAGRLRLQCTAGLHPDAYLCFYEQYFH